MNVSITNYVNNVDIQLGVGRVPSAGYWGEGVLDQTTLYALVGNRVRKAREKRGLTQKALAALVSLKRTSVTNIEKGKQRLLLHTFVDLAQALQVSPAELLGEEVNVRSAGTPDWDKILKHRPVIEQEWIKSALHIQTQER